MLFKSVALFTAILPAILATPLPKLKTGDIIPNQYIVVLKESVSETEFSSHTTWAANRHAEALAKRGEASTGFAHTYNFGTLKGYAGTFDAETIEEIATRTEVAYVEADRVMGIDAVVTQANAPWGLARISHRARGSTSYVYDNAGSGITAYVVDTGVLASHSQFGGRASVAFNAITGESATDGNGHGTHVSGTIAGTTYGVAKNARIIGVKVLSASGSGSTSGVIAGVQFVGTHAQSNGLSGRAVANMSLGGSFSSTLNTAVNNVVSAGVAFAVAAGNSNTNAANSSPASAASAITVAASTITDTRASFSNYGAVVDIFGPGQDILSAWIGSNSATNTISGTSMASPHIAGLAAYYLGLGQSANQVISSATSGAISPAPPSGTVNRLGYNGSGL